MRRLRGEPDWPVPAGLRELRSARLPGAVHRRVAVSRIAFSDHTSVLAPSEMRFMVPSTPFALDRHDHPHLTRRDQFAHTLEDMFDFDNSPSLNTPVSTAVPPANDCGPFSGVSSTPEAACGPDNASPHLLTRRGRRQRAAFTRWITSFRTNSDRPIFPSENSRAAMDEFHRRSCK
jgi:hypothetical protein